MGKCLNKLWKKQAAKGNKKIPSLFHCNPKHRSSQWRGLKMNFPAEVEKNFCFTWEGTTDKWVKMLRDKGMPSEKVKEDLSCVFEQIFVFQKKYACFLMKKTWRFGGKSFKLLIVKIISICMKCRYSWKQPWFLLYKRDSAKSARSQCYYEPVNITLGLNVPLTSKNSYMV